MYRLFENNFYIQSRKLHSVEGLAFPQRRTRSWVKRDKETPRNDLQPQNHQCCGSYSSATASRESSEHSTKPHHSSAKRKSRKKTSKTLRRSTRPLQTNSCAPKSTKEPKSHIHFPIERDRRGSMQTRHETTIVCWESCRYATPVCAEYSLYMSVSDWTYSIRLHLLNAHTWVKSVYDCQ